MLGERKRVVIMLGLWLGLSGLACNRGDEPALNPQAEAVVAGQPPASEEKLPCDKVLEWVRMRPLSKQCQQDSDCMVQRDNCCDLTAVNQRYHIACEKTCSQTCPQDSEVGRRLQAIAVCQQGSCMVEQQVIPATTTP